MDFYTASALGIVGAIVVFYVASYFYSTKYIPIRQKRGAAVQPLTSLANKMFKNGYTCKEPFEWLGNEKFEKIPYKTKKLFSLRNLNIFMNVVTVLLIILKNDSWWLVPVIQTIANIIAYAPKHQARNAIIKKMANTAYKKLGWGPQALLSPWSYVKVSEWDKNQPIKVTLSLGSDYDSTTPAVRDNFERHFDSNVSENNNWLYEWSSHKGIITITPVALLPEEVRYEGSEGLQWNEFAVGIGINGPVTYDIQKYPHVLVGGTTGSGKSVLQRNIIFHCIQHNYMWRFLGVDLKRVELGPFKKYETTVMGVASELEDGVEIVRYAQRVMNARYTQMEEAGVNHFKDLLDPKTGKTKERALLIMVDEAAMFMGTEGVKTDEGKARDELHGEAVGIIGALARLGRAAGVHLLLATQRPDATFIPGETKANLDVRIAAGRLDSTPSSMILDNGAATMLPGHIKGRGIIRYAGQNQEFQGYFANPDWIDKWLAEHPGVEPTIAALPGQLSDDELDDLPPEIDFEDGILALEADVMTGDIEKFAEDIEEAIEKQVQEEEEEEAKSDELKPKKKGLFGKKSDKPASDKKSAEKQVVEEPAVEESEIEDFIDDDNGEETSRFIEEVIEEPATETRISPQEQAIIDKMKQTFGEQVFDEPAAAAPNHLEDFALEDSGIPEFGPEGETIEDSIPAHAELPPLPAIKTPLPVSNAFPAPKGFPAPKSFPAPPAAPRATLPMPPAPKGFPPPPKK